jgi:hypothetical protein
MSDREPERLVLVGKRFAVIAKLHFGEFGRDNLMKRLLAPISFASAILALSLTPAAAQMAPRNYDKGPVTLVIQYVVKPGQLNTFMQDFSRNTVRFIEASERDGRVMSYSVEQPLDPRPGEPNLAVVIIFKNLSAYDRSYADTDKVNIDVYGSLDNAQVAATKRLDYATPAGRLLFQSLTLMK